MLTSRIVNSAEQWHAALTALPDPHPLQSWAWGELKSRWGWSMQPTVFEENGRIRAAALILRRTLPRLPLGVLYVPRGPVLDYADAPLRLAVITALQKIARQQRAIFIKIDPAVARATGVEPVLEPTGIQLEAALTHAGWRLSDSQIQFRNTVTLDITLDEDALLASFHQKTRYNIRYAARKDVVIREAMPADFDQLAEMYTHTAERNAFAIRPKTYYLDAWKTFYKAGMGHALIAEYDHQPLAAVYLVRYGNQAIYMYGASTDAERKRMPNYLLQWEAICWAKRVGCTLYDFWGAPDEFVEDDRLWGVWRFKSGFNGTVLRTIGAWDYPTYPALYWLYTTAVPRYLDRLRASSTPSD
jgi:lipid II:glycine glycyltransferase (peptidoglycan interpeptide bridge formation enzyme)